MGPFFASHGHHPVHPSSVPSCSSTTNIEGKHEDSKRRISKDMRGEPLRVIPPMNQGQSDRGKVCQNITTCIMQDFLGSL